MAIINLLSPMGKTSQFILTASFVGTLACMACECRSTAAELPAAGSLSVQPTDPPSFVAADPVAKTATFETTRLGAAIDAFEKAPTVENQSSVESAFAKLNGAIAKLDDRVVNTGGADRAEAAAKSNNLRIYRDAEMVRFTKVQPAEPAAKPAPFERTRLGTAIDTFEAVPTGKSESSVNVAFTEVDGDLADLVDSVVTTDGPDRAKAAARLSNLQTYRDIEMTRFTKVQAAAGYSVNPPADGRSGAQKVKDAAKRVGRSIETAAKDTGDAIKDATR